MFVCCIWQARYETSVKKSSVGYHGFPQCLQENAENGTLNLATTISFHMVVS
jgi:hypothetical protein